MIDIYFDNAKLRKIEQTGNEEYTLVFDGEKDETLSLVMSEQAFVALHYGIKNRSEVHGLIPVFNKKR